MRTNAVLAGVIVLLALSPVRAQTQMARVIAVTDFANISVDRGLIPPATLSDVLRALLQRRLPAGWRVIAGDNVRAAMRALGYTQDDLVYPSRVAAVARALGADWVVIGTWTQLRVISTSTLEDPPSIRHGDAIAIADVQIRVMEASSRQRLLEGRFRGEAPGGDLGSLLLAATEALRDAASRIARL